MNILCVSGVTENFTSNDLMNEIILIGLKEAGYKVHLITTTKGFRESLRTCTDNVTVVAINESKFSFLFNTALRMPYLLWVNILRGSIWRPYDRKALLKACEIKYDLILALCPPPLSAMIVRDFLAINDLKGTRYVQYWSDPLAGGMCDDASRIPWKRIFHKLVERRVLKWAGEVVYCSPVLCAFQKRLYPEFSGKMRWANMGCRPQNNPSSPNRANCGPIKVGYFGAFQTSIRNIAPLLEAFAHRDNVKLIVRGDSDIEFRSSDYPNVDIRIGRLPYKEVASLEEQCDILLCLGNIAGVQIPGKAFYYAGSGKPIIYIADGEHREDINMYLADFERYILCENRVDSINEAFIKALAAARKSNPPMSSRFLPESVAAQVVAGGSS